MTSRELLAEVAFWPARILLLSMICLCPWYYGSVTWQAQTLYLLPAAIMIVLASLGAMLRNESLGNPLAWSLAGLLALALFQTVQLPDWLWQSISTGAAFERSTDGAYGEFISTTSKSEVADPTKIELAPVPRTLSIHWVQTRASTVMLGIVLACLLTGSIVFRTRNWELVLLTVLAVSGLAIALLGLLQSVAWNKWTLLPMPTQTYFATFVSRNSAPQFLSIGLGAVLGLLASWSGSKKDDVDKKYYVRYPAINAIARFRRRLEELLADLDLLSVVCVLTATLMFVAVLAAGSRGGILACLAASVLTLCVSLGTKQSYARVAGTVTLITCGSLLLLTALDLDNELLGRLDSVNEEAYTLKNGRFTVWQMVLSQPTCWLPGCGLGNFHFAILPAYVSQPTNWFYHAENIYIELLAEFGLVGFGIGLSGLLWLVIRTRWCALTGRRSGPTFIASILAVSAIGLQSLVDFSLILPSICVPLATLVGCFLGRSYCADFGKVFQVKEHRKRTPKHAEYRPSTPLRSSEQRLAKTVRHSSKNASSLALLSVVLLSFWAGAEPLKGFAFAEQLSGELKSLEKIKRTSNGGSAEQLLSSLDPSQVKRFASHPEVNLQIGRLFQVFAEDTFSKQIKWPSEVAANQRDSLAEPANIAAAFRQTLDPRMSQLKDLSLALPQQIAALQRSAMCMEVAASVCSLDWRSAWGLVRSDLDLFSPHRERGITRG